MTIIRKSIFLMAICLLQWTAYAQQNVGFRIGATQAGVKASDALSALTGRFDQLTAFEAAIFTEWKLGPAFSIQPELAFSQKGFVIKETADLDIFNIPLPLGVKSVTKINYVEVPLLAKVSFGNERVRGFIGAGPSLGYAMKGRLKTRATVFLDIPLTNTQLDLDQIGYERWEVGGVISGGVAFATNSGEFFLDARYKRGFTDTYTVPVVDLDVRNSGFGLNVGYAFNLYQDQNRY